MSTDHKPYLPSETIRILKAGSQISLDGRIDRNLNVSRAIGDYAHKRRAQVPRDQQPVICTPDVKTHTFDPNDDAKAIDFVVLGCDGVWENGSKSIIKFIREHRSQG